MFLYGAIRADERVKKRRKKNSICDKEMIITIGGK